MKSPTYPSKYATDWPWVKDYAYDIECYPNFFSLAATHMSTGEIYYFEISEWYDMSNELAEWMWWLMQNDCRQIGFNNLAYDYYMEHFFFNNVRSWDGQSGWTKAGYLYNHSKAYFDTPRDKQFDLMIWESDHLIEQLDLFKIHHFDNVAKMTSLKVIEINMRADEVEELPVPAGTVLTWEQSCLIRPYNHRDVKNTADFARFSVSEIKLRMEMTEKYGIRFINHNDTKLGEKYFELQLKNAGVDVRGRTHREDIHIKDIIFDYVSFRQPVFNEALDFLRGQVIRDTKSDKGRKYPSPVLNGFQWDFGKGGIHGSIKSQTVRSSGRRKIYDLDVTSYYPMLAIVNKLFPLHLTKVFCEIYQGVFDMRKLHKKGTMENLAFKLALNGAYGKSNSEFSCFYDPLFTMTITLNGQLLLCMLGEWMSTIPTLEMIQANTDGITFSLEEQYEESMNTVWKMWEQHTGLELECAYYDAMHIRDVNNYIAEYSDDPRNGGDAGKRKCKGAYVYDKIPWHKNHSSTIIAEAAYEFLVNGTPVAETIMGCKDAFKFMLKTKVPRSSSLYMVDAQRANGWRKTFEGLVTRFHESQRKKVQNVTRYFVSNNGGKLFKVMPPTPKMIENWSTGTHYIRDYDDDYKVVKAGGRRPAKTYTEIPRCDIAPLPVDRSMGITTRYLCTDCSTASNFDWLDLNYQYYIDEAIKLIAPLQQS